SPRPARRGEPMTRTLAGRLADYAVSLSFDQLTPEAVREAKRRFIDSFATAVGAMPADAYAIARRCALRVSGDPGASLLGAGRTAHAIGIAGVCNVALRQTRAGELSMWKGCAFANAARNGVFAATLAADGMTGPAPIFEGDLGFFKLVTRESFIPAPFGGPGRPFMI